MRILSVRLGNVVSKAVECRLFGGWRLRGILQSPRCLRGQDSGQSQLSGSSPDFLCWCDKALKITDAKPGEWVAIYEIGGLGHVALQYAKTMGFNMIAADIQDDKLKFAKGLGADLTVNSKSVDPVKVIEKEVSGAHAALSVAVDPKAFEQAYQSVRRGGTLVIVGLPTGELPIPIFDTVLNGVKVKGSIVGTRKDLQEALDFAARGKVKTIIETQPLEKINEIFERMKKGQINGRIVLTLE